MNRDFNRAYLDVGTSPHEGWKTVSIQRSIEQASAQFSLELTETWPGEENTIRIRPGDLCSISIGNDLVITGYVDRSKVAHRGDDHTISVSGRSKTADIVDCSIVQAKTKPAQWKNRTIEQIADDVCFPYDVMVISNVVDLQPIKRFVGNVGATCFEVIEEVCREQRLLVTDTPAGELYLTRVGVISGPDFIHPGNILESSVDCDVSERFSRYIVKGQTAGDDQNWGEISAGVEGVIDDLSDLQRFRLKTIHGEKAMTKADAIARAKWESNTRAGRSASVSITVQGWRDETGKLYDVNRVCWVYDEVIGVAAFLLTVSVEFVLNNDDGQITRITLAPPSAYEPEPPKAKKITAGIKQFQVGGGVK